MCRGCLASGLVAFLAITSFAAPPVAADRPDPTVIRDRVEALFENAQCRYPGTAGNQVIEERVARIFAESGLTNGAIRFTAPTFVPGPATIAWGGGAAVPIRMLHPSLVRPGGFVEKDFTAPLVYLGRGTAEDLGRLNGVPLHGCIALMDFDGGSDWMRFLRFGVRGFIFKGADTYSHFDAVSKVHDSEVAVARYFIDQEVGQSLKASIAEAGGSLELTVHAEPSQWINRELRDLWVVVPGADPKLAKEVVFIVAPMDSNGVVPQEAQSAAKAVNLDLLLALLDQFSKQPPARTLVLAAVNAHTQRCLGERMLAWFAMKNQGDVEGVRDMLAKDIRRQELYATTYRELKLDGSQDARDAELIEDLRTRMDESTGKIIPIKKPILDLAKSDVSRIKEARIKLETLGLPPEQLAIERASLGRRQTNHTAVLTLFNKFGHNSPGSLTTEQWDIFRGYVREIVQKNTDWAERNRQDLERDIANGALSAHLTGKRNVMVFCLNFNWGSGTMGLSTDNYWGFLRWAYDFGRFLMGRVEDSPIFAEQGRAERIVDTLTNVGGLPEGHFIVPGEPGQAAAPQLAVFLSASSPAIPTFGLENVHAGPGLAFTPADTFDALNYERIAAIYDVAVPLLRLIVDEPESTSSSTLKEFGRSGSGMFSTRVMTFEYDEFASDQLPTLPVPGSLVVGRQVEYDGATRLPSIIGGDVVNSFFGLSDERCAAFLYGIRNDSPEGKFPIFTTAYRLDDAGRVDYALDAGERHSHVVSFLSAGSKHIALFRAVEMPILGVDDPSYVATEPIHLSELIIYDAARDSAPQSYGFSGFQNPLSGRYSKGFPLSTGPAAIYIESDRSVKALKGGVSGTLRTVLNASPSLPNGAGFGATNPIPPDFFAQAAVDMAHLNDGKVRKLSGVTDALIQGFRDEGSAALKEAAGARERNDHLKFLAETYRALGAQVKAYQQAMGLANDMLKAVVFYMALMLPFCFFLERLLFKTVRIEAQMGTFAVLFVAVYIIFRLIHPAFKIAEAPEAMFIAFVMGALGIFVIRILQGRFEGEMQLLFRTLVASDTAEVAAGTVGGQAMMIGVNNMKRRRIRTALTTGTIVLVTFTMLAFTSVSKKLSPTVINKGKFAPYTGIMYHWPDGPMDEGTLNVFRDMAADASSFTQGRPLVLERWWLTAPRIDVWGQQSSTPFPLENVASGSNITMEAILGLMPEEHGFLDPVPLLPGGRFFSARDAMEVIIPTAAAESLGLDPSKLAGARIRLWDVEFDVVGILSDERFRAMTDIDGSPLVPIKGAVKSSSSGTASEDAGSRSQITYYDTSNLILMPVDACRRLGGQPYSVSIKMGDAEPVWPVMNRLLTISTAKFYMASRVPFKVGDEGKRTAGEGVYYVGSNYRTSIGGLAKLIVPLLIASTIILNTMLGSVFERKAEIAIYNAVGLNPTHIGFFFLAESFVYSVIGSVGGYLIGQVLSIGLNRFGMISDINLNFSSLSVVYVILFTIAIVLLSTLYPAVVATRAAVPSGKRKWSMPAHEGDSMTLAFPFIYEEGLLVGIMHYVREYFANFSEASVGNMTAELRDARRDRDEKGRPVYELVYHVALAPYDLGVTQRVTLRAAYDEHVRANRITMTIARQSGQDSNWVTTNKPFLEKLRKYLMNWRNMKASSHALHVEQGRVAFGVQAT